MNPRKLRAMGIGDLNEKMADAEMELMKLRAQSAQAVIKKPSRIKELKKTIAQVNTIIKEKNSKDKQKTEEKND